jgi:hypothetical protein
MEKGLTVVIGMTISYLFSLAGLVFAWSYYAKNKKSGSIATKAQKHQGII